MSNNNDKYCYWSLASQNKNNSSYKLDCGGYFMLTVKSLDDSFYRFCPFCGRTIKEIS